MLQGFIPSIATVMKDAVATGLFISRCDIQDPPTTIGANGTLPLNDPSAWTTVISQIPCMDAPSGFGGGIKAMEVKQTEETLSTAPRHVLLSGYYPVITTKQRAVVDGVSLDILGVESDSQRTQTRLECRTATI